MIVIFQQKAYVFAFLLSARLFIPPSDLLARVCELCIKQQQLDQSPLDTVSTAPHVNSTSRSMGATLVSSASSQIHVFSLNGFKYEMATVGVPFKHWGQELYREPFLSLGPPDGHVSTAE